MCYKFGFLEVFIFLNKRLKCNPNKQNLQKKIDFWKKRISKCKKNFGVESQWFTRNIKVKNKSNLSVNSCMLLKTMEINSIV